MKANKMICSIVISAFAIVILSVIGALFKVCRVFPYDGRRVKVGIG